MVNRVGHLVAQGSRELLLVPHKKKQRIGDVDVTARGREGVGLRLVNQVDLERVLVGRLRRPHDRLDHGEQGGVQRR